MSSTLEVISNPNPTNIYERSKQNPVYNSWLSFRKKGKECLPPEWYDDFHAFADGVGPKPSPSHRLFEPNFIWTDRLTREQKLEYKKQHGINWRKNYPEKYKESELKKSFGITLDIYKALLKAQKNRCAICEREETAMLHGKVKKLAVDHDHKTGAIRGLLCSACNTALGKFQDNKELLLKAALYLEEHSNG